MAAGTRSWGVIMGMKDCPHPGVTADAVAQQAATYSARQIHEVGEDEDAAPGWTSATS